jgi:hypothetical protein
MQSDYWLATDCVKGGSVSNRVELTFPKSELGSYKQEMK